jgi:hypothetical protein
MFERITLVFLAVLLVLHIGTHSLVRSFYMRHAKKFFWATAACAAVFLLFLTALQYKTWAGSALTVHLLPPAAPASYFAQYAFFRIWSSQIISFAGALLCIWGLRALNKRREGKLLYEKEEWLAGSAVFLSGFPGLVFFVPGFLVIFLAVSLVQVIRKGGGYRVSPHFLWLPAALCVILLIYFFISETSWWSVLRL